MYIYIYIHIHINIHIHAYMHTYMHTRIYKYVYIYISLFLSPMGSLGVVDLGLSAVCLVVVVSSLFGLWLLGV